MCESQLVQGKMCQIVSKEEQLSEIKSVHQIIPNLYLTSLECITHDLLENLGIKCVINICKKDLSLPADIHYIHVKIDDKSSEDFGCLFDRLIGDIDAHRNSSEPVIINCVAGISRAPTLIMAYLMRVEGFKLSCAFAHTRGIRKIIKPNAGFWSQLIDFENRVFGKTSAKIVGKKGEKRRVYFYSDFIQIEIDNV